MHPFLTTEFMNEWKTIDSAPRCSCRDKAYVLAVDDKGRMSVGYFLEYSDPKIANFISAKAIGNPTHWMPLPEPPKD